MRAATPQQANPLLPYCYPLLIFWWSLNACVFWILNVFYAEPSLELKCSWFVVFFLPAFFMVIIKKSELTAPPSNDIHMYGHMITAFTLSLLLSALYNGRLLIKRNQKIYIKNLELETELHEAQLEAIKQQLNPHFIFNILNSLHCMIFKKSDTVRKMVTELSLLLPYSRYTGTQENNVTLQQEVNSLKDYLTIELLRFDNHIELNWNIEAHLLGAPVMPTKLSRKRDQTCYQRC